MFSCHSESNFGKPCRILYHSMLTEDRSLFFSVWVVRGPMAVTDIHMTVLTLKSQRLVRQFCGSRTSSVHVRSTYGLLASRFCLMFSCVAFQKTCPPGLGGFTPRTRSMSYLTELIWQLAGQTNPDAWDETTKFCQRRDLNWHEWPLSEHLQRYWPSPTWVTHWSLNTSAGKHSKTCWKPSRNLRHWSYGLSLPWGTARYRSFRPSSPHRYRPKAKMVAISLWVSFNDFAAKGPDFIGFF